MTTTRQRVLAYLKKHMVVTASDVSRDLGMTQANARHHLSILTSDGRVEVLGQRQEGQRGRPLKLYGLRRTTQGDNLGRIADIILDAWLKEVSTKDRAFRLRTMAQRLAKVVDVDKVSHITRRLALVVEYLCELNYQARWEAHAAGAHIILGQCPYRAIIEKHPELCQMDTLLLEELLGVSVYQAAKLEPSVKGLPFCMFIVEL